MLLQVLKVSVVLVPLITTVSSNVDYDNLVSQVNYFDLVAAPEPPKVVPVVLTKVKKQIVYVKTASWCRFCHQFINEYEAIKETLPYELKQIPDENGTNLPEIYWYKNGKRYYYNGYVPPAGIVQWL